MRLTGAKNFDNWFSDPRKQHTPPHCSSNLPGNPNQRRQMILRPYKIKQFYPGITMITKYYQSVRLPGKTPFLDS